MGWDYCHATEYKNTKTGFTVDRIAEIRGIFNKRYEVVKDTMKGSVYYGALRNTESGEVSAVVVLTHTNMKDFFNFGYKLISEDMGPAESECPASILSLLSPTESQWANEWRDRCRKSIEEKKNPNALKNLPVGAVIKFTNGRGETVELVKHPAAYQFKRPFWYCEETGRYTPVNRIPKNYEVVAA